MMIHRILSTLALLLLAFTALAEESTGDDRVFPRQLAELHTLEIDYADGEGMDFEPYSEFLSAEDTTDWIHAWTGNQSLNGDALRIFGQDGTGGYAAFWLVRPGAPILEQPIVFFGSEGEQGMVASNFSDYLWLLAGGIGPYEAIAYPGLERPADVQFTTFAEQHSRTKRSTPWEVVTRAQAEFPDFASRIQQTYQ